MRAESTSTILTLGVAGLLAIAGWFGGRASVEERFPPCPEDGVYWRAEVPGDWRCVPLDDLISIEERR